MAKTRAWVMAARPRTLPAAVGPVLVGTALAAADGQFRLGPALAAGLGALLLQILSNFANDYFDFQKGADTPDRLGPTRAMASGLLAARELKRGMAVVIGLAGLVGLYLIAVGGWPILAVGLASILAALLYTGGPFPFGYHGLGDLFVFVFFGLVAVGGTYYVQAGFLTPTVLVAAAPVGALITAILVVNNLRDIETDAKAGKRTLAVIFGRAFTLWEYGALLTVAYTAPLVLWRAFGFGPTVVIPWLTAPLAWQLFREVRTKTGRSLNPVLAKTAQLSLLYSILLALGVWL